MKQFLLIIFLPTLFLSCDSKPIKDVELHKLILLLTGEFSNEEQAENDVSFTHLNLKNIRIWENKPGYWLYSEVSNAKNHNLVYIQRIINYKRMNASTFVSTSYTILNPENYKGIQEKSKLFNKLTRDSIIIRDGCQMYFKKKTSTIYSGKIKKKSCPSSIDYIDYITSAFVISKNKISIWTKGYDNNGKQVWGKIKGPYKYKRLKK
ncbi:chromophore lyase CpcT/CpeT [Aquimarina muelleri]|uniref:CpeT/CpcT family n=1 Tax=Aquimarina muelleri TaxID=279356 RepID=A0A918N2Z5_9FLAO|nr:chromophore lyase CpcT/CpeT [Aquimarina muelleri]MCX2762110.1 chromophore lyase CpcT/CpeT [Aquimarina muelleri]GGX17273.1 hypothetical protein GCM10007384_18580 [Aquimarina muelleri]